jgi:hypothetical protein
VIDAFPRNLTLESLTMSPQTDPILPGIDSLRRIRDTVDPDRIYHLQLPDGTTAVEHGATLIRVAELLTAAVDAYEARDADACRAVLAAFARHADDLARFDVTALQDSSYPKP